MRIFNLLFLLLFPFICFAQYDFEKWKETKLQNPNVQELPDGIYTSDLLTYFNGLSVNKTTDSFEGSYSIVLKPKIIFDSIYASSIILSNGIPFSDKTSFNYFKLDFIKEYTGIKLTNNSFSLNFHYKTLNYNDLDSAVVEIRIANYNSDQLKFSKKLSLNPSTLWHEFNTTITYDDFNYADVLNFKISTTNNSLANELFIDDLNINYITNTNNEDSHEIKIVPTICNAESPLFVKNLKRELDYKIFNMAGELVGKGSINPFKNTIDINYLYSGIFCIKLSNGIITKISIFN